MDKGNYFLSKLNNYQCTFCNSDCLRFNCQRNIESDTYYYFKKYKSIDFQEDLSCCCTSYIKPLLVVKHDVT